HNRRPPVALKVVIHRLDPSVPLPKYETRGAAGFDLAARSDMVIEAGVVALIPTGLVIEVPTNHFLGIFARSRTPLKRGLMVANGVGVVDSDYCGPTDEIKIEVYNFTDIAVPVRRGDRLAQGVILPYARVDWEEKETTGQPARGGFGASGK